MSGTVDEKENRTESNQTGALVLVWEEIAPEVREGVEALREKKVENLRVYDLRGFTPFCDFVMIGTCHSPAQAKVAQEGIVKSMAEAGVKLWGVEGEHDSDWLLIDFWDTVIHLFRPETRRYYNLEALWADQPWWPGEPVV